MGYILLFSSKLYQDEGGAFLPECVMGKSTEKGSEEELERLLLESGISDSFINSEIIQRKKLFSCPENRWHNLF